MFFNLIKEMIRLRKEINRILNKRMLLIQLKEANSLRKEINMLLSKGMSNIYLKCTVEKNRRSQNFDCLSLKNLFQFLGAPTHADTIEF